MLDNADQFKHGFTSDDYLLILPSNLNEQPGASREHLIYPGLAVGRVKTRKITENLTQYGTRAN